MMSNDPNVFTNWLTIIQIISILGGGFYFVVRTQAGHMAIKDATLNLGVRLDKVDNKLEKLSEALIVLAKQEERMSGIDARLQELSNRIDFFHPIKQIGSGRRARHSRS